MTSVKPTTADRTYGGRSASERAAERRAALIASAFELIAQDGWSQLRIEHICRRAGLNKRYFYESFADLDAVTAAVLDHLATASIAATLDAMDAAAPEDDVVRAGISALVHHLADDPRRARVLFGETPAGEAAAKHRAKVIHQVVDAANARGRIVHRLEGDGEPVIALTASVLVGGTSQAVLDWLDGRLHADIEEFIDDLAALWRVAGDAAAARARGHRATR
jgi:AcrR family transcriptional regulator